MKILFISTWFPFPLDNGSRIRIYHLLRGLSKIHTVDLISFLPPEVEIDNQVDARNWLNKIEVVRRDPFWRDPRQRFTAHFSVRPRDIVRSYSPEMNSLAKKASELSDYNIVIASVVNVAPYALHAKNTPKMLEEHNFTTRWMEERSQAKKNFPQRIAGWLTWQKCLRYERNLYMHFQAISMVSKNDQSAVQRTIPKYQGRLEVIPNGVDLETRSIGQAIPRPDTIIFNGSPDYSANFEALNFFITYVLPKIWSKRPNVQLIVTGRTEGVDLSWLHEDGRIRFTGFLQDVRQTVAGGWIVVAPMLDGGGTRLKILEAMALGVPVVATTKGAEGLEVIPEEHLLLANDPTTFAEACLRLLDNSDLREHLAENAWRLVNAKYGWQQISQRFCEYIEEIALSKE